METINVILAPSIRELTSALLRTLEGVDDRSDENEVIIALSSPQYTYFKIEVLRRSTDIIQVAEKNNEVTLRLKVDGIVREDRSTIKVSGRALVEYSNYTGLHSCILHIQLATREGTITIGEYAGQR